MWENLAEWAALLVENKLAQVIFISRSPSISRTLAKALPSRSYEYINLSDATPEVAMHFVRPRTSRTFPSWTWQSRRWAVV
jgi:RNA12 protein